MSDLSKQLAEIMFPHTHKSIADLNEIYPKRPNNQIATRFAPSPTGYMHLGGLYVSLINKSFSQTHDGVFYLRIEDTDQSRKLDKGVTEIIDTLHNFDIAFDEGPTDETNDYGKYAPYRQSDRKEIYNTFAKFMVENDMAYPCFCSVSELEEIKQKQIDSSSNILGYGGHYAKCRYIDKSTAIKNIESGTEYVVRLKSPNTDIARTSFNDIVRGDIEMDDNYIDIVLIKRDGLPTYHFAHVVDDYLMKTTHVIRGDEWLPSLPLHMQMFSMLNITPPKYAHVSPIMKTDGTSKRKLSKRKDPEARVGYYFEEGYPIIAVKEYLLNLINSNFEEWRTNNPETNYKEFVVELDKMNKSGPLFDFMKLTNISKKIIKIMTDDELNTQITEWSKKYSTTLYDLIIKNPNWFLNTIKIWHENRMDVSKWSDLEVLYDYIYNPNFKINLENELIIELLQKPFVKEILADYVSKYNTNNTKELWFEDMKIISEKYNYAIKPKDYKNNPDLYNGSIVDISTIIRIALTSKKESPDIYAISQTLNENEVKERAQQLLTILENSNK